MSSTADRNNGRMLKNYIYANISLHKLAKILIEDWQIDKDFLVFINYFHLIVLDMEHK